MDKQQRATSETVIHDALTRLSSARREKLSKEDYDVFADGLIDFDAAIVRQVCEVLGHEAPAEFEPRFPPLHIIRQRCQAVIRYRWEQEDEKRRLHATEPPVIAPDKLAEINRQFKAIVDRHKMPRLVKGRHDPDVPSWRDRYGD